MLLFYGSFGLIGLQLSVKDTMFILNSEENIKFLNLIMSSVQKFDTQAMHALFHFCCCDR